MLYINSALEIVHLLNVNRFRVVRAINDPGREMLIASEWCELQMISVVNGENTIILIVFSFYLIINLPEELKKMYKQVMKIYLFF